MPRRWPVVVLLAALLLAPAQAAHHRRHAPAPAAPAYATPAFASAEDLKFAILDARAQAQRLLEPASLWSSDRVDIYVERGRAGEDRQVLRVSVDGSPPVTIDDINHRWGDAPADALHRVAQVHLADGSHRVHIEYASVPAPAASSAGLSSLALDQPFHKGPGELSLILQPRKGGLLTPPRIHFAEWQSDQLVRAEGVANSQQVKDMEDVLLYTPGGRNDPHLRYAHRLAQSGQADDAVVELWLLAYRTTDPRSLSGTYWLESVEAQRKAGLLERATNLSDRLESAHADPTGVAMERLKLAESEFEAGHLDRAQALLDRCRSSLPEYMSLDWRLADALVLFERNQTAAALDVLKVANPDYVEAFRYMNDPEESFRSAGFRRFNLGVALLQHGQERQGLSWLDLVGRYRGRDRDLLALRDRANLTLGWHFLKTEQGRTAIGALGRVSSEGLYANPALLGIGWAQLAPAGQRWSRTSLGDESVEAPDPFMGLPPVMKRSLTQLHVLEPELNGDVGPRMFEGSDPPSDRSEGLRRAIAIWKILAARDIDDPAVQEATLAIAYASGQLGQRDEARDAYAAAITQLKSVEDDISASERFVREGHLAPVIATAPDMPAVDVAMDRLRLPPGEPTRALYAAIGQDRDLQDSLVMLQWQDRALGAGPAPTDAATALVTRIRLLERAIGAAQADDSRQIEQEALVRLEERRHTLDAYLRAAYVSMVQYGERPRVVPAKSRHKHRRHHHTAKP